MAHGAIGYDVVLIAHVGAGLIGFGSIAVTGLQAAEARRLAAAGPDVLGSTTGRGKRLRQYFSPGPNRASQVIYLVPLLGLLLVGLSGRTGELADGWLDGAATLWVIAVGLAHAIVFPAERGLQAALADPEGARTHSGADPPPERSTRAGPGSAAEAGARSGQRLLPDAEQVARLGRRAERGVALVEICYVAAFVLMYVKPRF